jgi:SAM-dependent methyltransferase
MILVWVLALAIFISFGLVVFRGAPYVPSHRKEVEKALSELYLLSSKDTLVDFGSGDGLVLRAAARRGANAIGYEVNPFLVALSRLLSRAQPSVKVHLADAWAVNFPVETTVVYAFAVTRDMPKLLAKLQQHATATQQPLLFISYGTQPHGQEVVATLGAHGLYRIAPLQPSQA